MPAQHRKNNSYAFVPKGKVRPGYRVSSERFHELISSVMGMLLPHPSISPQRNLAALKTSCVSFILIPIKLIRLMTGSEKWESCFLHRPEWRSLSLTLFLFYVTLMNSVRQIHLASQVCMLCCQSLGQRMGFVGRKWLRQVVESEVDHFWPNFQLSWCNHILGLYKSYKSNVRPTFSSGDGGNWSPWPQNTGPGLRNRRACRMFTSHVLGLGSIPWALPGMITEQRAWSKPWAQPKYGSKTTTIKAITNHNA